MPVYGYGFVLFLYLALFFAAARSERGQNSEKRGPFTVSARFLYHRYKAWRMKRNRAPELLQESRVKRDLAVLYPEPNPGRREEACQVQRIRNAMAVILAGDLLAILLFSLAGTALHLQEDGSLRREGAGGEDVALSLTAQTQKEDGSQEEGDSYTLLLHSVRMTPEETERLSAELAGKLPAMIKGTNPALDQVSGNLFLPPGVEGYPFSIAWESSSYALLDSDGTVSCEGLQEEGEEILLTAILTYDDGTAAQRRYEHTFPVRVVPAALSPQDQFRRAVQEALTESEQSGLSRQEIRLPSQVEGVKLLWKEVPSDLSAEVFILFLTAGFITAAVSVSRLQERVRRRDREILLAYPQIVSKLVLYLGAGVSVRGCFAKLGENYRAGRKRGAAADSIYEEVLLLCRELESGVPETEAYAHFGRRCRARQYTRLCTLLIQNLRKGNRSLLAFLQEEARESIDERRNTAREIGEEAQTKLLLPMGMMLLITMVMVIVPAYCSFSI